MTELERINGEAAAWVVRLHSDQRTQSDREAFRAWMEADVSHVEAFEAHATIWETSALWSEDAEAREILRFSPLWSGFGRRLVQWGAVSGAVAAALAVGIFLPGLLRPEQAFRTVPGELRTISLKDGSTLQMDTDSEVTTRFTAGERQVVLARGQAYFRVAKDHARPFRVFVGQDEIRAVGTAFEVRRVGDHAAVVLEEGRLALYRGGGGRDVRAPLAAVVAERPAPTTYLDAGQALDLRPATPWVVQTANVVQASAWRYGRVVLDDTRLGDAAADLNRYGGPQIVLADPRLGDIRVSGVFHTGRPRDVVDSVVSAFPVRIASDDGKAIVLEPAPRAAAPDVVKNSR